MAQTAKLSWKFPKEFWTANIIELFERCAYYAMFIALTLYLTNRVGFTDVETGFVVAFFAALLYFMPALLGALADRIGFRAALILSFAFLTGGYALLGAYQEKVMAIASLGLIMLGGAGLKPIITGTVAKCSDDAHRARAFSIFYQMVNIGSFRENPLPSRCAWSSVSSTSTTSQPPWPWWGSSSPCSGTRAPAS